MYGSFDWKAYRNPKLIQFDKNNEKTQQSEPSKKSPPPANKTSKLMTSIKS